MSIFQQLIVVERAQLIVVELIVVVEFAQLVVVVESTQLVVVVERPQLVVIEQFVEQLGVQRSLREAPDGADAAVVRAVRSRGVGVGRLRDRGRLA